jgi:hypothetical protein
LHLIFKEWKINLEQAFYEVICMNSRLGELKNNSGISLISVLIGLAITGIISLIVMQLVSTSRKAQTSTEINYEALELIRNIETYLGNSTRKVCESTLVSVGSLSNFDVAGGDSPIIISEIIAMSNESPTPTPIPIYQTGDLDFSKKIVLQKMRLIKFQDNGPSDPFNGFGLFEVTIAKKDYVESFGGQQLRPRLITLRMQLWSSGPDQGTVLFCAPAASVNSDYLWSVNGNGSIYYNGGFVGVGTSAPGRAMQVVGEMQVSGDATSGTMVGGNLFVDGTTTSLVYYHSSDQALKSDIKTIDGLQFARKLRGVSFKWKINGNPDLGFVAQEVEQVIPYIVNTDNNSQLKSVNYDSIVAILIESIKTLDQKLQEQDLKIKKLEREIHK